MCFPSIAAASGVQTTPAGCCRQQSDKGCVRGRALCTPQVLQMDSSKQGDVFLLLLRGKMVCFWQWKQWSRCASECFLPCSIIYAVTALAHQDIPYSQKSEACLFYCVKKKYMLHVRLKDTVSTTNQLSSQSL